MYNQLFIIQIFPWYNIIEARTERRSSMKELWKIIYNDGFFVQLRHIPWIKFDHHVINKSIEEITCVCYSGIQMG